jgi:hypothetical protein
MSRRQRRGRLAAAPTLLAAADLVVTMSLTAAGAAQTASRCAATHTVNNSWPGCFGAPVDVKNVGDAVNG